MIYFLKKTSPSKKGTYLQIYINYYDPATKSKKTKSYKSLGYVSDLIDSGIADPISHFSNVVKDMNASLSDSKETKIGYSSLRKNLGFFLVKAMFDKLDMEFDLTAMTQNFQCRYKFYDLFRYFTYAQIISPGSKLKAYEDVLPNIYGCDDYSYDQVLDFINFIGINYHMFIEVLNKHISDNWKRDFNNVYFDCTNYYFEIDLEDDFRRKGPSKENRKCPIMGQALLLDGNQIPLDTEFYPGNESEKPYLRSRIENMKSRNEVKGKVIHVADKGLNCSRNIYAAVKEANDGYIFSKSIKGHSLDEKSKEYILKDSEHNPWITVYDSLGFTVYRYREESWITKSGKVTPYGKYKYHCKLDPNDDKETEFEVIEKRIYTYNPKLAAKQKAEINREVDKLKKTLSCRRVLKTELGDMAKFVNVSSVDENGKEVKIVTSIDENKVQEELKFAGYNCIVTSEINADPKEIYNTYHRLWRIEESFRVMKTYLEARPAFLSLKESVFGHFTMCYIALTMMRLLELKTFKDEIPISKLFEFIRQYTITKAPDNYYINNATRDLTIEKIQKNLGLLKLDNAYLKQRDVDNLLNIELD